MTAEATDALVDAIDASYGLPVPTPREFAARIEQQLAARGHEVSRRKLGGDEPGDWGFTASDEGELAEIIAAVTPRGISVVAEGIETIGQLYLARDLGCTRGQGYLIGRPMSCDDLEKLVSL